MQKIISALLLTLSLLAFACEAGAVETKKQKTPDPEAIISMLSNKVCGSMMPRYLAIMQDTIDGKSPAATRTRAKKWWSSDKDQLLAYAYLKDYEEYEREDVSEAIKRAQKAMESKPNDPKAYAALIEEVRSAGFPPDCMARTSRRLAFVRDGSRTELLQYDENAKMLKGSIKP